MAFNGAFGLRPKEVAKKMPGKMRAPRQVEGSHERFEPISVCHDVAGQPEAPSCFV